jgi:hypothetical protein
VVIPRAEKVLLSLGSAACLCLLLLLVGWASGGFGTAAEKLSEWWGMLTSGGGSILAGP